jgi:LysM repeat protein
MAGRRDRMARWLGMTALASWLTLLLVVAVGAQEAGGYWYTVRRGDSWASIAARTSISVATLQRANPHAIHRSLWLYPGERLWIPRPGAQTGTWYTVQAGDSWTTLARRFGMSVRALQQANPQAVRRSGWLYRGERLWIPGRALASQPLSPQPSGASSAMSPEVACPQEPTAYGAAFLAQLTAAGDLAKFEQWLSACGLLASSSDALRPLSLTGDSTPEALVVLTDLPTEGDRSPQQSLFILRRTPEWVVDFQADPADSIQLLEVGDINADKRPDVAWSSVACGAHTCFTTVYVLSWTGTGWEDWIDGELTMANAVIRLQGSAAGAGRAIVAYGGVIGSVGAGPQRAWTETWISQAGAPYTLVSQIYDPAVCLYHVVLDANQALGEGRADSFEQAVALYRRALIDANLRACWDRPDELTELRSFAGFRLAVAYGYQGDMAKAQQAVADLLATYPDAVYARIADIWWRAYQPTQDMVSACAAVDAFVAGPPPHPEAVDLLANYGYANPTFTAAEVCPIVP